MLLAEENVQKRKSKVEGSYRVLIPSSVYFKVGHSGMTRIHPAVVIKEPQVLGHARVGGAGSVSACKFVGLIQVVSKRACYCFQ